MASIDFGPDSKLLERDLSLSMTAPIREVGRKVLRAIIDEGITVFERCNQVASGGNENIPVLFPFLHILEVLDGLEVLLDGAVVNPANSALRAAFESQLALEWVTKAGSPELSVKRARAFVVVDVHRRIQSLNRFDPSHPDHKQFAAEVRKDQLGASIAIPMQPNLEAQRAALQAMLGKPDLLEAATEYERTRERLKRKFPPFHACWDGPPNLEELARALGRSGRYAVLYRFWAGEAHGDVLSRQLTAFDGEVAIRRLRDGNGLSRAYSLSASIGLEAIRAVLGYYRPQELTDGPYRRWYEGIQNDFMALGSS